MTNGGKPYGKWPNSVVIEQVVNGYVLPCPEKCPEDLYDACIAPCFIYETKQRPAFATLVERFAVVLGEQNQSELEAKRKRKPPVVTEEDKTAFKATALQRDEIKLEILSLLDEERIGLAWNHGEIDEAEAERRLRLCAPPGVPAGEQVSVHERELFLLRELSTLTLVVSILREGNFGHHAIDYDKFARVWIEQRPPKGAQPPLAKGIVASVHEVFKRWKLDEGSLLPLPKQDVPKESDYSNAEVSVAQLDLAKYMALDEGAVESEEDGPEAEAEAAPEEAKKKKQTKKEKKVKKVAKKEAKKRSKSSQDGEATVDTNNGEDGPAAVAETNIDDVAYSIDDVAVDTPDLGRDDGGEVTSVAEVEPDSRPTAAPADPYGEDAVMYTTVVPTPRGSVTVVSTDTAVTPPPESESDAGPAVEIRSMYTTMVFGDGAAAQKAVNGSTSPFAHDIAQPAVAMEDPFAATAIQPVAAPQASALSPPPRAAPRRPSNYTPPPAYGAGAKKPAPVVRPKNARTVNALNPFGEEDSQDEESSDEDQPPPEPKVKIAALKEKKATRPVTRPRKIGNKKDRKNSGGALMFDDDADAESEI